MASSTLPPIIAPIHAQVTTTGASTTPPIVTKLVALLVALAGPVLAFVDPSGKLSTPAVQAAVVLGGLAIGAVIYVVHIILENGLSKAGLEKTVSEEEAWFKQNYATIRSTFEAAQPALDQIPGVPAALSSVQSDLDAVKTHLAAIPAADQAAIESAVKALVPTLVIPQVLAGNAAPAQPAEATAETPLPAPAVSGNTVTVPPVAA